MNFSLKGTKQKSMKRSILYYTWLWNICMVSIIVFYFLYNPSQELRDGLTGIAALLGIPLTSAYAGFLVGEYNNRKDAEVLAKFPNLTTLFTQQKSEEEKEDQGGA